MTFQAPDADRYSYSASYLRGRVAGMLAGRAAEELVYSDITTGAENDLEQATGIAKTLRANRHGSTPWSRPCCAPRPSTPPRPTERLV